MTRREFGIGIYMKQEDMYWGFQYLQVADDWNYPNHMTSDSIQRREIVLDHYNKSSIISQEKILDDA